MRLLIVILPLLFSSVSQGITITSGVLESSLSNSGSISEFPNQASFRDLVTSQFTIQFMASNHPLLPQGLPILCSGPNPFGAPCTLAAGSYSMTYSQVNQAGMNLVIGGNSYSVGSASGAQWALNLTYTLASPVSLNLAETVLFNTAVTGDFSFRDTNGTLLLDRVPLTSTATSEYRMAEALPSNPGIFVASTRTVFSDASPQVPEPATWTIMAIGLAAVTARTKRISLRR